MFHLLPVGIKPTLPGHRLLKHLDLLIAQEQHSPLHHLRFQKFLPDLLRQAVFAEGFAAGQLQVRGHLQQSTFRLAHQELLDTRMPGMSLPHIAAEHLLPDIPFYLPLRLLQQILQGIRVHHLPLACALVLPHNFLRYGIHILLHHRVGECPHLGLCGHLPPLRPVLRAAGHGDPIFALFALLRQLRKRPVVRFPPLERAALTQLTIHCLQIRPSWPLRGGLLLDDDRTADGFLPPPLDLDSVLAAVPRAKRKPFLLIRQAVDKGVGGAQAVIAKRRCPACFPLPLVHLDSRLVKFILILCTRARFCDMLQNEGQLRKGYPRRDAAPPPHRRLGIFQQDLQLICFHLFSLSTKRYSLSDYIVPSPVCTPFLPPAGQHFGRHKKVPALHLAPGWSMINPELPPRKMAAAERRWGRWTCI